MYRQLQAFLRLEREEIAAVPGLLTPWRWPRAVWLLALPLLVAPRPGLFALAAIALLVQLLLLKARAGRGMRLWALSVFFLLPLLMRPEEQREVVRPRPWAEGAGLAQLREACLERRDTRECRVAVRRCPDCVQQLGATNGLLAWKVYSRSLRLRDYPAPARKALERQLALALADFYRRDYQNALNKAGDLRESVDSEPEVDFLFQASALGAILREENVRRTLASDPGRAHRVTMLERDGEALRWSAASDKNARARLLDLAVRLRAEDHSNKRALEWMRALGVGR